MNAPYRSYATLNFWASVVVIGANLTGAFLIFVYYSFIDPVPQGGQAVSLPETYSTAISIAGTIILMIGGIYLRKRAENYYPEWYRKIEAGEPAGGMPDSVRREVINYPFASALSAFAMWILAGFFFSHLAGSGNFISGFFRVFGVGGLMATAVTFFAIEWLWRPVIPYLIPDGRLNRLKAARLSVLQRLILVFFLIGSYPSALLSVMSVSRGRLLLTADNPEVIYNNLIIAVIFIVIVNALASIGMALLVTRSIVNPLDELAQAMSRVEMNDFDVSVPVVSKDEIGYVSEKFNDMARGLKRGELLRNLLNLYVSPEVAREALEHGTQLGGQTVDCTVLFSDIRGFTTISEQLAPDVLMDLLNRYMSAMVDVIVSNGGMVNKFGGDSLLAVFGTPLNPSREHAWGAVKTALDMRAALQKFNQEQAKKNQPELKIGIGVATGKVVAGNIGGHGRIEYTVIGDTVNLASRLQSLTKEVGKDILINEPAYLATREKLFTGAQPLPPLDVRGKKEPVNVFGVG